MAELRRPCPSCPPPRCFTSPIARCLRSSASGSASSTTRPSNSGRARHNGSSGTALPGAARWSRGSSSKPAHAFVAAKAPVLAHLSRVDPARPRGLSSGVFMVAGPGRSTNAAGAGGGPRVAARDRRATVEALYGSDHGEVERAARSLAGTGLPSTGANSCPAPTVAGGTGRKRPHDLDRHRTARPNGTSNKTRRGVRTRSGMVRGDAAAAERPPSVSPARFRAPSRGIAMPIRTFRIFAYGPVPGDEATTASGLARWTTTRSKSSNES